MIGVHSEGSLMAKNRRRTQEKRTKQSRSQVIPIDVLPDDVLLVIFDFCVVNPHLPKNPKKKIEAWQSLVHVCRRWRSLVFGSPRRLNLKLACTSKTPARDTLDVWPDLPLIIRDTTTRERLDDVIPVLRRSDRVCRVELKFLASQLEKVSAAMQEPFPELKYLSLGSYGRDIGTATVLPDSFLGGYAPRLRFLSLYDTPFPGLLNVLLSATHLVHLGLQNTFHPGYVSPEAMVTALSTLTSLEQLSLGFASPRSRPDQASRLPLPTTRTVLPVLTTLRFKGASEYLEDLVARIDAPRLFRFDVTFFNDVVFDLPQLAQFICRTSIVKAPEEAHYIFWYTAARVDISSSSLGSFKVEISCKEFERQVSSLDRVCIACLPLISTLKDLYISEGRFSRPEWRGNIENTTWLNLLHPFTTVKNLYISKMFTPRIVAALQELVGGGTADVLPTLQNIFLEELEPSGPVQEGVRQFVAARQVTGHQIVVSRWNNSDQDLSRW